MPTPSSRPSAQLWRGVTRAGRLAAPTVYVGTALLGVTATALPSLLIVGLLAGAAVGLTIGLADPGFPASPDARRRALYATGIGVLLLPFATGIGLLGGAGVLVVPLLLVLCAVSAAGWLAELDTSDGAATSPSSPDPSPPNPQEVLPAPLPRPVDQLTTEQLFTAWSTTGEQLRRPVSPATRVQLAEVRSALLEELLRREPEATARWLEEGAPATRHDRDGGTPV